MRKRFFTGLLILLASFTAQAQEMITGKVIAGQGAPVSGATVMIKGTSSGTTSANDGSFSLAAKAGDVLKISYVGYKNREVLIGKENTVTIVLSELVGSLDALVVTGYTTQRVKEISGSVAIVKPEDLTAIPAGQVQQMLQGRVAGLTIIHAGEPGSPASMRLHGIGNTGDIRPLVIIDGVEGNLNFVNPYDIESIQVLKDAGAYSIYGVRGANGVIVITTKRGKGGKTRIVYEGYAGIVKPLKRGLELLNPQENADLLWLAMKNSGLVDPATGNPTHKLYGNGPKPILPDYLSAGQHKGLFEGDPRVNPTLYNLDPDAKPIYQIVRFNKEGTDWFHESFKPAINQYHGITASGGSDKNNYLFSLGYLNQQGTLINSYLKRYTLRMNSSFSVNDAIRIGENFQLGLRQHSWTGNQTLDFQLFNPAVPVYDIRGNYSSMGFDFSGPAENPIARRALAKDDANDNWQIFGNIFGEIDLFKKVTVRTSFGGDLGYDYSYNLFYNSYQDIRNSTFSEQTAYNRLWLWTNTATYTNSFGNHRIKLLAGTEERTTSNRGVGGSRRGYYTIDPSYRVLSTGNPVGQNNFSYGGKTFLSSFISRVDYNYKEKYFFTGIVRNDGSSIFGPKSRFGWFPAFSAAWRLTEEPFTHTWGWVTDLKLRGSWGKTGFYGNTDPNNQYNLYASTPGGSFYDINGTSGSNVQSGLRMVRIGNANTGWQEDVVANLGMEAILWKGKLSITADVYNKSSKGLLFGTLLPAILGGGMATPNVNIGEINNKGIDVLAGSKGRIGRDWTWDLTATFTHYKNKIVKLNELPFFDIPLGDYGSIARNGVGRPMGSFFGYKVIGLFQDDDDVAKSPVQDAAAPGRFKYLDADSRDPVTGKLTGNPDGKITEADRIHFGNPNPDFTLGLNIAFTYKAFDFSTFLYGSFGNDIFDNVRYTLDIFSSRSGNNTDYLPHPKSKAALYHSWTPERRNTRVPKAEVFENFSNSSANSYSMEKGTYLRNRTMIVGYTFPKKWLDRFKTDRLRMYVQAVNLFTITKYSGLDPEMMGASMGFGINYFGHYPNNEKQYIVGVNLQL